MAMMHAVDFLHRKGFRFRRSPHTSRASGLADILVVGDHFLQNFVLETKRGLSPFVDHQQHITFLNCRRTVRHDQHQMPLGLDLLDRRWKSALMEVRAAEAALAEQSAGQPAAHVTMGKAFTSKVMALAGRLPQIWADPATTDAHRKALPGGQGGARPDARERIGPYRMARRDGDRTRRQDAGNCDRETCPR